MSRGMLMGAVSLPLAPDDRAYHRSHPHPVSAVARRGEALVHDFSVYFVSTRSMLGTKAEHWRINKKTKPLFSWMLYCRRDRLSP